MRRIPVSSSAVVSVGYDAGTRTLEVEFAGGGVYQYSGVPRRVFDVRKPRYPYAPGGLTDGRRADGG